jgi:endonuclease YncB( thermonuclease family)
MKAAAIRVTELIVAALLLATTPAYADPVDVLIVSCYDGDTCKADRQITPGRNRVSLANVDTPELDGKCRDEVHRAVKARDYTQDLAVGKTVTLTAIRAAKRQQRVEARVQLPDGRDLGNVLVAAGLARPYRGGPRGGWCE